MKDRNSFFSSAVKLSEPLRMTIISY